MTDRELLILLKAQIEGHLAGVQPPPGPVDPPPPPPPPPPPVESPAGDNPFIEWKARGLTLAEYVMLRNGGIWLSPAQEAQARAAGYVLDAPQSSGPGVDHSGLNLTAANGYYTLPFVTPGVPFTVNYPAGGSRLSVSPVAGSDITHLNGALSIGGNDFLPAPGTSSTFTLQGSGPGGQIRIKVQWHP